MGVGGACDEKGEGGFDEGGGGKTSNASGSATREVSLDELV